MEITLTALTGKNVLEGGEGDNYLKGHGIGMKTRDRTKVLSSTDERGRHGSSLLPPCWSRE